MWKCRLVGKRMNANYDTSVYGMDEDDMLGYDVERIFVEHGRRDEHAARRIKAALRNNKRFRIVNGGANAVLELERC